MVTMGMQYGYGISLISHKLTSPGLFKHTLMCTITQDRTDCYSQETVPELTAELGLILSCVRNKKGSNYKRGSIFDSTK